MDKEYLIPLKNEIFNPYFILVILSGLYISFKLKFPQIRYFLLSLKVLTGTLDHKGSKGQLVHSQAFFAGTSSSLLIGAAIGSAFALKIGGFGSLVWIWVASFFTMPIRLMTSSLAIKFRVVLPNGRHLSGPMYFIEKALRAKWLAIAFASTSLITVLSLGGIVPMLSVTYLAEHSIGLKGLQLPLLIAGFLIFVVVGGIRRVGKTAGILMPIGIVLFFLSYFLHFGSNLKSFTGFLQVVFREAFQFEAVVSGSIIAIVTLIGQSLGAFFISTETGVGKIAGISGVVRTDSPIKQGLASMMSSFFEGFIISTLIFYLLYSLNAHTLLQQKQFVALFLTDSSWHGNVLILSLIILAFTGICSWFYTGEQSAYYILGEKFANFFRIFFIMSLVLSAYAFNEYGESILVQFYKFGYTMAIVTAIPVLISLLLLVKIVSSEMNKYFTETGLEYEIFKDFYILILSILPKNLLSKVFGLFTQLRLPRFMMIPLLTAFAKMYKINVDEAELHLAEYKSLNLFFTRSLKAGARIVSSEENAVVSPVDAKVTAFGKIDNTTMIQAKGIDFSLKELLGSNKYTENFESGQFITFYLSPQDYHRIHSPFYGKILGFYYEPGKLFPVNDLAVKGIRGLFPKNERLITFLQTEYGKIAVVKVGASNVGKIRVTYDKKIVTNTLIRFPKEVEYDNVDIMIQKGAELGRFEMGSTVILVFERDTIELAELQLNSKQTYGSTIGNFKEKKIKLPK
ncbi:MAG: archaetidylserine decarboxylase [Spirochaetota bacterium]